MAKEKENKSLLGPLRELPAKKEIDAVMEGILPEAKKKLQIEIEKDSTVANLQKNPKVEIAKKIQEQKAEDVIQSQEAPQQPQPQQQRESLNQGFKDALMYFGPRLGAMILGGTEAAEITDRVMTGFERFKAQGAQQRVAEQVAQQREGVATRKEQREEERLAITKGNLQARIQELKQQQERAQNLEEERELRRSERELQRTKSVLEKFGTKKGTPSEKLISRRIILDEMEDILTDAPEIAVGVIPFKIAKGIAGEVGNLTDAERKAAQISPSFLRNLERTGTRFLQGKLPEKDVQELQKVVNALRVKINSRLKDQIDRTAKASEKIADKKTIQESLYNKYGFQQESTGLTDEELEELKQLEEEEAQGLL